MPGGGVSMGIRSSIETIKFAALILAAAFAWHPPGNAASPKLVSPKLVLTGASTIAWDGVGVILHASNPVAALSQQQIRDIYTGKIVNWKTVDGKDAPITVVNKADGRSTLELFLNYLKLKNSEIKPHVIIGDNSQGIKTVSGNPNAIGYVSIGTAEYEARHGLPIKLLPLDGIRATTVNVRNGTFPLSRPLNLVTRGAAEGLAREFINFARSAKVHDLVEAQYFVPAGVR